MTSKDNPNRLRISSRSLMLLGAFIAAVFFAGGGYMFGVSQISGAIVAPGTVAVQGKPKSVQHLDGGLVAQISIKDGDFVEAGYELLKLDVTLLDANVRIYSSRLQESVARQSRLMAERDGATDITWQEETLSQLNIEISDSIKAGQQKLFLARRASRTGQLKQFAEKIEQFESQIIGIAAISSSKEKQIELIDVELAGLTDLYDKQLLTYSEMSLLIRERERLFGERAEQATEVARVKNSINEIEIQILLLDSNFREEVITELRATEQEVNDLAQQLFATLEQRRRTSIRAPVAGIVHESIVATVGGIIGPGEIIMQIIPQNIEMEVKSRVETQFIDELYFGQPANVRFSAFNQRTTPEVLGAVTAISASSIVEQNTGFTYYEVTIGVPAIELEKLEGQKLLSGMPAEVFIKTKDRTILNYLLKPFLDQVRRAFREE